MSSQPVDGLVEDLRAKFDENVTPVLGSRKSSRLAETILGLTDGASPRDVVAQTVPAEVPA
jgi:hypothetical protein